jgi:ATP diphosphatase
MARLRDPQSGCPWDLDQDFASLVPHTLEEAYEVAEAAESGDPDALCDELGDLLFQVVFYARIGEENGQFGFDQVADAISDKLIRRHPHVFGDQSVADIAEQTREWERLKAEERGSRNTHGALAGVSTALPALTRSAKLSRRAARVGFDWPDYHGVLAKIDEEIAELRHELDNGGTAERIQDELGDLLFSCANLARKLKQDPETALRATNRRFEGRFRYIEQALEQQGTSVADSDADTLERLWSEAKQQGD